MISRQPLLRPKRLLRADRTSPPQGSKMELFEYNGERP